MIYNILYMDIHAGLTRMQLCCTQICVSVCVYIHTYVYIHNKTDAHIWTCTQASRTRNSAVYKFVYVCVYTHVYTQQNTHTHTHMDIHAGLARTRHGRNRSRSYEKQGTICMYVCLQAHTFSQAHVSNACIYIYMYICISAGTYICFQIHARNECI